MAKVTVRRRLNEDLSEEPWQISFGILRSRPVEGPQKPVEEDEKPTSGKKGKTSGNKMSKKP
jgi:hypothetical protein